MDIPPPSFDFISTPTYRQLTNSIRQHSRSHANRLRSITSDAEFARTAVSTLKVPAFTNSRGGDWYFNPGWEGYAGKCYFKSTDGHYGNYGFSRRRLGLEVLEGLKRGGTVAILDSTRRGKRYPDSFTKTIPIWIKTLNDHFFPSSSPDFHPHPMIPAQESSRIQQLLPAFLQSLRDLGIDSHLESLRPDKPLRAIWVDRATELETLAEGIQQEKDQWCTLVLVMVSRVIPGEGIEGEYIQGAGDDAENWIGESGLSPDVFWRLHKDIMTAVEKGESIQEVLKGTSIEDKDSPGATNEYIQIHPSIPLYTTTSLPSPLPSTASIPTIINCTSHPLPPSPQIYTLSLPASKKPAKHLRTLLPPLSDFLAASARYSRPTLVLLPPEDPDGVFRAVVAYVLARFYDDDGVVREVPGEGVTKETVGKRVAWVVVRLGGNVVRDAMKGVNSALMAWQ